ncbi:MAG: cyclase family protein [Dehalococcoidia bacterium]|nr:cyclase family protein [Dehalococcoidia bacterium]
MSENNEKYNASKACNTEKDSVSVSENLNCLSGVTSHRRIYDITQVICPEMPLWPGDAPVALKTNYQDGVSLTSISMSAHCGTHVDAPCHVISGGVGVSGLNLQQMYGKARVCDMGGVGVVDSAALSKHEIAGVKRLLIKTSNSELLSKFGFSTKYVYLAEDAARFLLHIGIKLLAVDYLSVDAYDSTDYAVHRLLLEAGVIIVEGVNLSGVPPADYEMVCLPLRIATDGAPARVILRSL